MGSECDIRVRSVQPQYEGASGTAGRLQRNPSSVTACTGLQSEPLLSDELGRAGELASEPAAESITKN